jgi:SET domain-containing protein
MLYIKTKIQPSEIHGIGVFADEFIPKGTIIWKFTSGFDVKFTREQILDFPELLQIYIYKYSWKGTKSKLYCFSSDNGKYFNHSNNPNTLSKYQDNEEEVITTAVRDIQVDEELTDNYSSFEADEDNDNVLEEIRKKYNLLDEADPRVKNIL